MFINDDDEADENLVTVSNQVFNLSKCSASPAFELKLLANYFI